MKKNILLILLLFILLFSKNLKVNADAGSPPNAQYEVIVSSVNEVSFFDYNDKVINTIPNDTILTVIMESENINGEKILYVNYKDQYGYIKLSDTQLLYEEYPLEKAIKYETERKYWVLEKEETYLYADHQRFMISFQKKYQWILY